MRNRSSLVALLSVGAFALVFAACSAPAADGDAPDTKWSSNAAAPSSTELADGDAPTDIVIPDPTAHASTGSSVERSFARSATTAPVTAFLNRAGGTFQGGADDSSRSVSSVLSYYNRGSINLPAAGYGDADWQSLVACVKSIYAPYNVTITDSRPSGVYTEIVVTNAWASSVLGISNSVGGIAPIGQCRAVPQAVGFVFEPTYDRSGFGGVRGACEAAAHELGHTLSLSHEQLQSDLMSYAPASLSKKFQDSASACGVSASAPESCSCGGSTQDSAKQLLSIVGASTGGTTTTPSTGPTTTTTSTIAVVTPANGASVAGNGAVTVSVDGGGASNVRLVWQYTGSVLPCDGSVSGVTCTTSGTVSTWTVLAGTGPRSFYAIGTAANGAAVSTAPVSVTLTGGTTTTDAPPSVSVQLPADRVALAGGATVVFQAAVSDDNGLSDVRAIWTYNGGTLEYPMVATTTPGVYQARTTVSTSASAGWRAVDIVAADTAGQRTMSVRRYVYIQ